MSRQRNPFTGWFRAHVKPSSLAFRLRQSCLVKPSSLAFRLRQSCLKGPRRQRTHQVPKRSTAALRLHREQATTMCSSLHNKLLAVRETPCISPTIHTSHLGPPRIPPSSRKPPAQLPPIISEGCRPARVARLRRVNTNKLKVHTANARRSSKSDRSSRLSNSRSSCLSNSSAQGSTTLTETRLSLPQSTIVAGPSNNPHLPSATPEGTATHSLFCVSKAESDRFSRTI